MKSLWDPVQGPTKVTLARRARILLHGVRANGFDDLFTQRVALRLSSPVQQDPTQWRHNERESSGTGESRGLLSFVKNEERISKQRAHQWMYDEKCAGSVQQLHPIKPEGLGREVAARAEGLPAPQLRA